MTERGFNQRAQNADTFAERVYADIRALGFGISANGVEAKHPAFKAVSQRSTDRTSLSIRFAPDAIGWCGSIPRAFYLDAKAGLSVERFAWEQYAMLSEAGCVVVLAFKVLDTWCWNVQSNIHLIPAESTLARFAAVKRFPVQDGWITPRLAAHWTQTKRTAIHASGTAYREVSSNSLLSASTFKPQMIDILKNQIVFNPF